MIVTGSASAAGNPSSRISRACPSREGNAYVTSLVVIISVGIGELFAMAEAPATPYGIEKTPLYPF
jgi:hypothetical protein